MTATMKIDGLQELDAALKQFAKSTQRSVLERTLKKAAKPIEAEAKKLAPEDTGELKSSIRTTVIRSNAGKAAFAEAMRSGATRMEAGQAARAANRAAAGQGASATVRVAATAPHSIFAEFGTVKMSAQPFMRPALHFKGKASVESIKDDLHKEIMATAKRVAARRKG